MEIEFPEKADMAFREGYRATCMAISSCPLWEFAIIASGYKKASDVLIEHLDRYGRDDSLVYPIIFGYRHYLELTIKTLWIIVNKFDETGAKFKPKHRLNYYWDPIKARLLEKLDDDDLEAFEAVEQVLKEFQNIDTQSDKFRFPGNRGQFNIDLGNMREVMQRVGNFLDSLLDVWEAEVDAKS